MAILVVVVFGANLGLFLFIFVLFLNTMTNIVQNLTMNGRSIDGVLGKITYTEKAHYLDVASHVTSFNPFGRFLYFS